MAVRGRGYDGAVREQLADLQRGRMLAAMFDVAARRGVHHVTVAHVVERSGVSRRTFYELFSDREDCLRAAFEQALAYARGRVLPAYEAQQGWRDQIRAALIELLCFLDEQPVPGKLLIAELHAGGEATAERREEVLGSVTAAVMKAPPPRAQSKASPALSSLTAEGVVGGALSVIHSRLSDDSHKPLLELANPLMSTIVLPYLGPAVARRELERSVEPRAKGEQCAARPLVDPFKDVGMRLTYRTVRVLIAVAENPNASNRLIGETAGMTDQGQISKLLARLRRIGLISNTGLGPGQGAPNAWTLTPTGMQAVNSIRTTTTKETRR